MGFLRWLGGLVVLGWLIMFIFSIGGSLIHWLLVVAAVVFIIDLLFGGKKQRTDR